MSRALRVVHLPARTPYVRKITSEDYLILNGANTEHGVVPTAVTASWLLDRRPLDWLDVLHLHHIEFDDFATLQRLLTACASWVAGSPNERTSTGQPRSFSRRAAT